MGSLPKRSETENLKECQKWVQRQGREGQGARRDQRRGDSAPDVMKEYGSFFDWEAFEKKKNLFSKP
ncbi:unnamed protein product [Brassica rapa subsp. trilocularis]